MGIEGARPGIRQVPKRRAPGRRDAWRRGGFAQGRKDRAHTASSTIRKNRALPNLRNSARRTLAKARANCNGLAVSRWTALSSSARKTAPEPLRTTLKHGNSYVTIVLVLDLRAYVDLTGRSPFQAWFAVLDSIAAAKVTVGLARLEQGNLSNAKSVGTGVMEYRVDFGPGYRVYFGRDGDVVVILLGGGTKKRQQRDIESARER